MFQAAGTLVKRRRRSISFNAYLSGSQAKPERHTRGAIKGWNDGMGRRLGNYIENFRQDFTVMVTLTYGEDYPGDGPTVKSHLRALVERMRRMGWFEKHSIVWFLEFQERGAPHFHFLSTGWVSKGWISNAWAQITGGNPDVCTRCEAIRNPEAAGAYARKYAMKSEQKAVPAEFKNIGRMWGCCGARILQGVPRVPVVSAATLGALPGSFWSMIKHCEEVFKIRVAQTLSGFVLYGTEQGITRSWHYLKGVSALRDLTDLHRVNIRPATVAG